jgi:hypothetical protein
MLTLKRQIIVTALTGMALCGMTLRVDAQVFKPAQVKPRSPWRSRNANLRAQQLNALLNATALNGLLSPDGSGVGDYLQGGAAVIEAQGQFMKDQQEAYRMKEEVRRLRTENRLLRFEEERYERENTPVPEELRQQHLLTAQRRAMANPPVTEIWSARSLNEL